MALVGNRGYFSTSGPGGSTPGSDELYEFDPFTGDYNLVGSFSSITGDGFSGLALVPEPGGMALFAFGLFLALGIRRFAR